MMPRWNEYASLGSVRAQKIWAICLYGSGCHKIAYALRSRSSLVDDVTRILFSVFAAPTGDRRITHDTRPQNACRTDCNPGYR